MTGSPLIELDATAVAPGAGHPKGVIEHGRLLSTMVALVLLVAILLVVFAPIPAPWNAVVILVACVLEVVEVVILRRWSKRLNKRTKKTTGADAMIGEPAKVVEPCRPDGIVHLRGELWAARCDEGADTGETVTVKALEGLKLVVTRTVPAG